MNKIAYLLTRLTIGMSMLGHGLIRIPKLQTFADGMIAEFAKSPLPSPVVTGFAYAVPFVEFITGALLLMGWFTKAAAVLGCIVMLILIFGSSMIENWSSIPSQMLHVVFFVVVIQFWESNSYAMDNLRKH